MTDRVEAGDRAELTRRIRRLGERISSLGAASVRASASLDLGTVLREVAENARALTGATGCAVVTIDGDGTPRDVVASGITEEERQRLAGRPDGLRLPEHPRDLPGGSGTASGPARVRGPGVPRERVPPGSLRATPMRHRGVHVGDIYLLKEEGAGGFTPADGEILALFASQAATAVANARAHHAVERARADLEAVIETSPVGVVVFDAATGRPVSINGEGRRILDGLRSLDEPPDTLPGVLTCGLPDGREVALSELSLAGGRPDAPTLRAEEIVLSVPDGRSARMLVSTTPVRSGDGPAEAVAVTMQDLAPLEETERRGTEFLGMVGHELRAPIAAIKGSAAILLEASPPPGPAEMREFHRIILAQADQMRALVSDLLDAGRIESGTLSVVPEPSEVASLVDGARATFLTGGNGHAILIDLPPELPQVMADRRRIVQVLGNLLSNAARHAPPSSPIRVTAIRDGAYVRVAVVDEGRGVAPERLPHLFRKYSGLEGDDREARTAASGLGLSISKGIVEAHGGRIWAESSGIGQGTCVTFTVPVADPGRRESGGPRPPATAVRDGGPPATARVLVVDDDPQTLRHVRDVLTRSGYGVAVAGDHRELAAIIRSERPDLVLLDLILPGADGIELLEWVPELADLPVIFISAYGRDETIARAFDAGAADYIVKPFSATELVARIRAALRRQAGPELFAVGELSIDYERRRVTVGGTRVDLTPTEYELLRVLSLDAGRVSTYEALMRRVWGRRGSPNPKLVRAFVKKLRRKLGDGAASPTYIINERGVGYRMAAPERG